MISASPGNRPHTSGEHFKRWLFDELCRDTPVNREVHGVVVSIANNTSKYSLDCVQRLQRDELMKACYILQRLFSQCPAIPGSCAAWSHAAEQAGHHVGNIYVVEGGRGEPSIRVERHPFGIFK